MANGTSRLALAQIQLKKEKAQDQLAEEMKLVAKGSKLPKISLKNPTPNNHSK